MDYNIPAFLILTCLFAFSSGSVIQIETSHNSLKPLLSTNMTVRCSLKDSAPSSQVIGKRDVDTSTTELRDSESQDSAQTKSLSADVTQTTDNMQYALSVVVSRDGVDLAQVNEHLPATAAAGLSGFEVSGQVNNGGNSGELGYLELHWSHPSLSEAGTYKCEVSALNKAGHGVGFAKTLEIDADDVTLPDLVHYVHNLLVEKEVQNEIIASLKDDLNKTNQELNTQTAEFNLLKADYKSLKADFNALKAIARTEPSVYFMAGISTGGTKTINSGVTVIYDKVYANQGGAYDQTTGIFTAPISGYFKFEIYANGDSGSTKARLRIKVNDEETVETMCWASSDDYYNAASNSLTTHLMRGDKVAVVSRSTYSSIIYTESTGYPTNTFSGQILSVD